MLSLYCAVTVKPSLRVSCVVSGKIAVVGVYTAVMPVRVLLGLEPLRAITIDNAFVLLPVALVALTVKLNVFAVVGVPAITPAVRDKPSGNDPVSMLHVIGVSPVAVSVWLYAVPTVPFANDVVVIVGAVPVVPPLPLSQATIASAIKAAKTKIIEIFFIFNLLRCNLRITPAGILSRGAGLPQRGTAKQPTRAVL